MVDISLPTAIRPPFSNLREAVVKIPGFPRGRGDDLLSAGIDVVRLAGCFDPGQAFGKIRAGAPLGRNYSGALGVEVAAMVWVRIPGKQPFGEIMKDDCRSDTLDRECLTIKDAPISSRRRRAGQATFPPVELSAGLRDGVSVMEASCTGKPGLDRPSALCIDVAPGCVLHHRRQTLREVRHIIKGEGNRHRAG